jgi:opacity protein-like surface antigen
MKKIIGALALSTCFSVFAEENPKDSPRKLPENGIYVGAGLSTTSEKHDFSMDSVLDVNGGLKATTFHSENKRKHNGQFFIGYKVYNPIFLAVEINFNLNKDEAKRSFEPYELPGADDICYSANLSIKKGNDLSLLLKAGKTFCSHITPYVVIGLRRRRTKFDYVYPRASADMIANAFANGIAIDDFSYADRSFESNKMGFVYGAGVSFSLEKNFSVRIEYNCLRLGDMRNTTLLAANPTGNQNMDVDDIARHYLLKNKSQHSLSIAISRSFSFEGFGK